MEMPDIVPEAPQSASSVSYANRTSPAAAAAAAEYDDLPDKLFNDSLATGFNVPLLKREKPEHREMLLLKLQGYTNIEIARMMGVQPVTVGYVMRQPWARLRLIQMIQERGLVGVDNLLRSEVVPSILTLAEVRDDPDARKGDRVTAARVLMEQWLGKPLARVESAEVAVSTDIATLSRQLEELKQEEAHIKDQQN